TDALFGPVAVLAALLANWRQRTRRQIRLRRWRGYGGQIRLRRRRGYGGQVRPRGRRGSGDGRLHIAAHHAPGVARALDLFQIDLVLLRYLLGRGRRTPLVQVRCRRSCGYGGHVRLAAFSRCRGASLTLFDDTEHFAALHVGAGAVRDAAEDAGLRGGDLEIDLVGLELDERLSGGHRVAFVFQPSCDPGVDDRLTDFGDNYVRGHPE